MSHETTHLFSHFTRYSDSADVYGPIYFPRAGLAAMETRSRDLTPQTPRDLPQKTTLNNAGEEPGYPVEHGAM